MSRTRNELVFVVSGRPVPAARMTQRSKFASARAKRALAYQELVAWCARAAAAPLASRPAALPFTGPVELTCRFFFRDGRHGDLTNLIKAIEDGLVYGGLIANDKQILRYGAGTGIYFAEEERAEVRLRPIGLCRRKEVQDEVASHAVGRGKVRVDSA